MTDYKWVPAFKKNLIGWSVILETVQLNHRPGVAPMIAMQCTREGSPLAWRPTWKGIAKRGAELAYRQNHPREYHRMDS